MIFMSSPATSFIHLASAAAAAILLVAGLAFQLGRGQDGAPAAGEAPPPGLAVLAEATAEPGHIDRQTAPELLQPATADRPMLAVIIDDVGLDRAAAELLLERRFPVTLSVLPFADSAPEIARAAAEAGMEVFLHLPMEPVGLADPGPNALLRSHDEAGMAQRTGWALSRVPGAVGFNNHMGSAMTADDAAMARLFAHLQGSGLIFVDSLTHPRSRAAYAAAQAGLPALRRDVFLDHVRTPEAVDAAIEAALQRALQAGTAIAIGHPHAVTLEALEGLSARAAAYGVELVPVSQLAGPHARRRSS